MHPYQLEVSYAPGEGERSLLFVASGALVLAGIAWAFARHSLSALLLSVLGLGLYGWLLLRRTQWQHLVVLTINEKGIEYMREPVPGRSTSMFTWSEVMAVSARLASKGEDVQGLEVFTTRYGPKGTPILLPIGSEAECRAALEAAKRFHTAHAKSAA